MPVCNFEDVIEKPLQDDASHDWKPGVSRTLKTGADATLVVYGALMESAFAAVEQLAVEGINVGIVDARFCKPLDGQMLGRVLQHGHAVLTIEDHSLAKRFWHSAVLEYAVAHNLPTDQITRLGMPDRLIAHATRAEQLAETGLDPIGIAQSVRDAVRATARNTADSAVLR